MSRGASGFPSPADDYREAPLDLHRHLVRRPASTFFMHLEGDAHRHAGLHHGDLLVIDRAISPRPGHWLVAVIDGELSVLRLERRQSRLYLAPSQPRLAALPFDPDDARLWGVICYVIHALPAEGEE
ncbi:peptidase S24 [Chromohalobacter salexigens]|nr:peptidase S24 [Chromohalobacter salexigens]